MGSRPGIGTLWIGDLEPFMDETFLKQVFLMMGEHLLNAKVVRNKFSGVSLGYGFLEFGDEQTAQRVLHRCNNKVIPNTSPPKRLKLNHATFGLPQQKEYALFVGELTQDVDDLRLFNVFSAKYSTVKSAKVVMDDNGISKGYGFVRFTSESEQQNALVEMQHSRRVGGKPIRLSLATPKKNQQESSNAPSTESDGQDSTTALMEAATAAVTQYYQYAAAAAASYDYNNYYAAWHQYYQYAAAGYDPNTLAAYAATGDPNTLAAAAPAATTYQNAAATTATAAAAATTYVDASLEDHESSQPLDQLNEELIARNEELYESLDTSRWWPTDCDGLYPTALCK